MGLKYSIRQWGGVYIWLGRFLQFFHQSEISKESNANSVAIKLTNGENSFVFTKGCRFLTVRQMVNSGLDLSYDVLSVGHHGSTTSTSWDFLQAAVPEFGSDEAAAQEICVWSSAMRIPWKNCQIWEFRYIALMNRNH